VKAGDGALDTLLGWWYEARNMSLSEAKDQMGQPLHSRSTPVGYLVERRETLG